jgi:hypothetical protein
MSVPFQGLCPFDPTGTNDQIVGEGLGRLVLDPKKQAWRATEPKAIFDKNHHARNAGEKIVHSSGRRLNARQGHAKTAKRRTYFMAIV